MSISRLSLYGNPNLGAFTFCTDLFALVPPDIPEGAAKEFNSTLGVPVYKALVGSSVLLGIFVIGNSNGLILPYNSSEDEIRYIESVTALPVALYEGKKNALGNMVLVNDRVALIGNDAPVELKALIEKHLRVEVVEGTIAGLKMPGVCAVVNNKGLVVHPLTTQDEMARLGKIFNTPVDVSTVNCGFPYLRVGMTANSRGAVVGQDTTGPEMARIESSLGLVG